MTDSMNALGHAHLGPGLLVGRLQVGLGGDQLLAGLELGDLFLGFGGLEYLVAVDRNHRFVGGHHMLAMFDGFEHQFFGDIVAADQFHQNMYIGVAGDIEDIARYLDAAQVAGRVIPTGTNVGNSHRLSGTARNIFQVALHDVESTTAYGAETA